MEYLMTYGWALMIIAVVAALLYHFFNVPTAIAPPTCSFESGFTCQDLNVNINPANGNTIIYFEATDASAYGYANVAAVASVQGGNTTSSPCVSAGSIVPAGGAVVCVLQVPSTSKVSQGQFLTGSLYLTAANCATNPNYLISKSCTGAATQTIVGSYTTHASSQSTSGTYAFKVSPMANMGTNTVLTVNGVGYA